IVDDRVQRSAADRRVADAGIAVVGEAQVEGALEDGADLAFATRGELACHLGGQRVHGFSLSSPPCGLASRYRARRMNGSSQVAACSRPISRLRAKSMPAWCARRTRT